MLTQPVGKGWLPIREQAARSSQRTCPKVKLRRNVPRVAGSSRPALAMTWVSSKQLSSWSRVWEDPIEKAPSWSGIRLLS
jgi:hypothetical protein